MSTAAPSVAAPAPAQAPPDTAAPTAPVQADSQSPLAVRNSVRLPGVIPDDDAGDFPSPPAAASSPATPGTLPARGPDGKFTSASGPSPQAGDHPETADTTTKVKFKFAGEEFDSQELAEQNFKSLRGQFKPLQQRAAKAAEHEARLREAAESARGWKAEHDRVLAERGQTPAKDTPSDPAESDIDWELYSEIKRLATDSGEPWKAEKWLIDETRRVEQKRVDALLDQRLAPLREAEARQAVAAQTEQLFGALADYVTSDGSIAYPELHDEAAAFEVGKVWAGMGLPAEFAMTAPGAVAAIGLYRMMKGSQGGQAGAAPVQQATPTSTPAPQTVAAAGLDGGRPSSATSPDAPVSTEAARILAGLKQAHMTGHKQWNNLGFEA